MSPDRISETEKYRDKTSGQYGSQPNQLSPTRRIQT